MTYVKAENWDDLSAGILYLARDKDPNSICDFDIDSHVGKTFASPVYIAMVNGLIKCRTVFDIGISDEIINSRDIIRDTTTLYREMLSMLSSLHCVGECSSKWAESVRAITKICSNND